MSTYLILGGTGKTGSRLTLQLNDAGHDVRAAARHPQSGGVRFDWDDPATHDPALEGVDGVWVVPPALRVDHPPLIRTFAERAKGLGVGRLVVLSARGGNLDPASPLAQMEAAVAASGIDFTVIRPTWFMQNFTDGFFAPAIVESGVLVAPAGDGAEPFIDVEDIAGVAAAALTEDGHTGASYDLSGPEALSFARAAEVLSQHAGRTVTHVDPSLDDWKSEAVEAGLPAAYAELLGALFRNIASGQDAALSDGVQRALGREPGTFEQWAAREAGALAAATPA